MRQISRHTCRIINNYGLWKNHMDWKTFISEMVGSLAWPSVTGIAIWQLKEKLGELLPRLKRLKHKDTELEFAEGVIELAKGSIPAQNNTLQIVSENREELFFLASHSPRSAILEAYRQVETAAIKAIKRAYPELQGKDVRSQVQVSKMLRDKILSDERYIQLRELLSLRNTAAHDEEFSLKGTPIETYIDVALLIANELDVYRP